MIALVTGAGSGVGQAIAETLARAGYAVALVGRRYEKLLETQEQITQNGGESIVFCGDISIPEDAVDLHSAVVEHLGAVDLLVNNAGVHTGFLPIVHSDPSDWLSAMMTNLYAPYLLSRLCVGAMLEKNHGHIVNISSAAGFAPPSASGADYVLSKYALNFFTRQLAAELEATNVSCCAIHPGEVQSEMWAQIKHNAEAAGEHGTGMRGWAELVESTGGDPPQKAADLILKIVGLPHSETNGKFLWIEEGIQKPRPTW